MILRNKQSLVTIVIPVYKPQLTQEESISLQQCVRILNKYPMYLVTFADLDISTYQMYGAFNIAFFDSQYFKDIAGYNQLMISYHFYERFKEYQYMLIYQLDAYVFYDELIYWCQQGYDYIGAPWFERVSDTNHHEFFGVGNGGFSLRKIPSFLKVLKNLRRLEILQQYNQSNTRSKLYSFLSMCSQMVYPQGEPECVKEFSKNEDGFWTIKLQKRFNRFFSRKIIPKIFLTLLKKRLSIAPVEEALKFSFECQPTYLYKFNNNQLPFGCHAWKKYEPEFWSRFIPIEAEALLSK